MNLQEKIAQYYWFHTIDLGDGLVTPGAKTMESMRLEADLFFAPLDLHRKTVLDVGAWNGGYSLEALRRGASRVVALDHATWNHPDLHGRETFDLVNECTNNRLEAIDIDLDQPSLSLKHLGLFDVVLYAGVFYHLQNPLAATRELAGLAREVLILETYIETIADPRPAMVYYPANELANDHSNWWGPNIAFIQALLARLEFPRVDFKASVDHTRFIFHAYRS